MFNSRTLLEGKWALLILATLSVAGLVWCWPAAAVSLPLLAFTIAFFRDPAVNVPADEKLIVAPATGKIVEIQPVAGQMRVAIFLSVFDVHVQRAPVAGTIKRVTYQAGKFLDVRHPAASAQNEYRLIELEMADGYRVAVRQIAGLIARRIVSWADEGATLAKGEHLGMIRFGSRVELSVPLDAEIVAKVGERAIGGETILAKRR